MTEGLIHSCTLQIRNRKKKFSYTGGAGAPVVAQTVTGAVSGETAIIDKIGTGYIVVKSISGTFTTGEGLSTGTWSGTLSAQEDYRNQSGEYEYFWTDDQADVSCRFYYPGSKGKGAVYVLPGEKADVPMKCMVDGSSTIEEQEYRIVSVVPGYSGIFGITSCYPMYADSATVPDHYEAVLTEVL